MNALAKVGLVSLRSTWIDLAYRPSQLFKGILSHKSVTVSQQAAQLTLDQLVEFS
jgi:hypothetical protein